jgi:glycosyltransferase involved in cell wall biosynthesis
VIVLAPDSINTKKYEIFNNIRIYRFQYFLKKYQKLVYNDSILQNLNENKILYFQVPLFLAFEIIKFLKIVYKEKIEIVHAHWIFPQGFLAAILRKIFHLNFKIIITSHGGDIYGLKNKYLKYLIRWALNNSDFINPVSHPIKNKILKMNINKSIPIRVLSMGVETEKFYKEKENKSLKNEYKLKKYLLFVGRLSEKKGVRYLIKAIPLILKKYPQIKLLIIGEGKEKNRLISLSNKLNIGKNVIFAGNIPNNELLKFYSGAEMFIGPSIVAKYGDTEGLGLTFIEAMLCKCPVIGTRVGGISDVIIHEETGLLIDKENPEQLANAVIRLLKDKNSREKMTKNAKEYAEEKYSLKNV